jgi:hypothetical protein
VLRIYRRSRRSAGYTFLLALMSVLSFVTTVLAEDSEILPVAEVHAGMSGYGLTVFHGTQIDTFRVEILAVLRNYGPKRDAIVARLTGGPLAQTGVAQGMSGSPVYIDGRLIGAVAWTSTFTKEPLAGITPFEYMTEIPDRPMVAPSERRYTASPFDFESLWPSDDLHGAIPQVWDRSNQHESESARTFPEAWSLNPDLAKYAGTTFVPIQTPVSVTGIDPNAFGALQDLLGPFNMRAVQGGTVSSDSLGDAKIEPGSSLGVALATGDISLTSVGTVTSCDGDTVLGFGHPMYLRGQIDFPMSLAYVHFTWPSSFISYKMASGGRVVGAIRQDRRFGIAGVLGEIPDMLPVEINITGGVRPHTIRYQVVRDRDMAPNLIGIGLFGSLYELEKIAGPATIELTTRIDIEGHEPIVRNNFYTDDGGLIRAAQAALAPLAFLSRNPFEPIHINSITIDVDFTERIEAAFITGIELPRRVVRPGEPLVVRTLMQNYLGDAFEVDAEVPVPEDTPEGVYLVRVGGGPEAQQWAVKRMPGKYIPENLPHLIDLLKHEERNDRLHVQMVNRQIGMTVENRVLPDLPTTTFETLRHAVPGGRIGPVFGDPVATLAEDIDAYVIGEREISVAVYRYARPR